MDRLASRDVAGEGLASTADLDKQLPMGGCEHAGPRRRAEALRQQQARPAPGMDGGWRAGRLAET